MCNYQLQDRYKNFNVILMCFYKGKTTKADKN